MSISDADFRAAGFHYEDELACDCCGLYAYGMDEYQVCGDCNLCPECAAGEPEHCPRCGKEPNPSEP